MEGSNKSNLDASEYRNLDINIDPVVAAFVYDFLQYKLNGYPLPVPENVREAVGRSNIIKIGKALRSLADEFSSQFKEQFLEMCEQLEVSEETMKLTIEGVANELFSDGIKWARIVAFFVFGSELAIHCKKRNWPELINTIALSLSTYISEKLLPWINDHGGWEGLIVFNESSDSEQNNKNSRWPSVRNLLCLGISAIGALTIGAVLTKS